MAERCACGHEWLDHAESFANHDPVRICHGDFGECDCEGYVYLEEEDTDDEQAT